MAIINDKSRIHSIIIGNLLAFSAALCWGFNEPANKSLIPDWVSAPGVAFSRIFGAALIIWIISVFTKNQKIERTDQKLLWASALCMLGFVYVFSLAFNTASPIDIAIILTFQPMLVVAIHAIFKHEKVSKLQLLGMLIALGGALLVILAGGNIEKGKLIGDIFAMICAISYAAYLVIIEGPSKKYTTVTLMRWIFLYTAILSLPFLFTIGHVNLLDRPQLIPMLTLAFIVMFPTVYCYVVTPPALRMIGSELFSVYQYLVPIIATFVSLWLKLDSFHWYQPVSFIIIVAGVILANYAKAKSQQPAPTQTTSKKMRGAFHSPVKDIVL